MRIHQLIAENIKRLSVVEITPDGSPVVVLAGENESGKSSCLECIEMALGGERHALEEPIRRGERRGSVKLDLGDIIVTRTFTQGGSALKVTNREGAKFPSPQALLDEFYSKLTFDPLEFARAKPAEQAAILRTLAGLDFSDLEARRAEAYQERTLVNRDLKSAETNLQRLERETPVAEKPLKPMSVTDITRELEAADALAEQAVRVGQQVSNAKAEQNATARKVADWEAAVEKAKRDLAVAERALAAAVVEKDAADHAIEAAERAHAEALAQVPDRAAIRARLGEVEGHNRKVEAQRRRQAARLEVRAQQRKADDLSDAIKAIDAEKAERLSAAHFPVQGLGLDDEGGVTWNGLPFSQASTAIRTRVSVAIGLALNPKLPVLLIRNGNDLDGSNLKAVAQQAADAGAQLWIERIDGGNGLQTVWIEDGTVVSVEHATEAVAAQ